MVKNNVNNRSNLGIWTNIFLYWLQLGTYSGLNKYNEFLYVTKFNKQLNPVTLILTNIKIQRFINIVILYNIR